MQITVIRERLEGERRIALTPESVKKLVKLGATVTVESGAGAGAGIGDEDFTAAGATIATDITAVLGTTDVLPCVNRPTDDVLSALRANTVLLGFLRPLDEARALSPAVQAGLTVFAMELVPRITRAQVMDALSSMATVVGYKAVLTAANRVPRMFPLLMTAAGTVPPAHVLVLGAGVAGLQAIATAKRLGAVVEAYDIRAAAGEQVRSLGGRFLEVDLGGIETEDAGGYAKELSEEAQERGRQLIAKHAAKSDVVITTAQIPGRPAPLLLTEEAVKGMKKGSIVIDLAGANGGNCALTKPGEDVVVNGVTISSPLNLAAEVPADASQLYARNITAFLENLIKEGKLVVNLEDDVLGPACVAHEGKVVNARVAAALDAKQENS